MNYEKQRSGYIELGYLVGKWSTQPRICRELHSLSQEDDGQSGFIVFHILSVSKFQFCITGLQFTLSSI